MASVKYVDIPAIVQVIGGIYNQPNLIENESYFFTEEDFTEEFHKIIFGSIYNLFKTGAKEITPTTIEDYLLSRPKKLAIYKQKKGEEYLQTLAETTQLSAFDYYYNRMKKMTLLRMYQKAGMNLSWLYDIDTLDAKKKQAQEDWLDNTSLQTIADMIDDKIQSIRNVYVDDVNVTGMQIGDGIDDLLKSLSSSPAYGIPLYGKCMNTVTRGARLGKFYLRSAATGVGKALPNSTLIPTPNGNRKVGDIKVGDYLFDAFGNPTQVKAIYPQGEKDVWEVEFKDGRKAKCCEEHLWSYCTGGQRKEAKENRKFYTSTLKELSTKELYQKGHGYKILVPMQKAVNYPTKEYYIKPYSFGLLLGDGSFRYQQSQKALSYSSEDEQLPTAIADEMNWSFIKNSDFNYNWTFKWKNSEKEHPNVWVEEALKDYPELWNVKSENKFIPTEYLEGDVQQRFDLLNGLLDSDGSVDQEKGKITYFTISSMLKDNVVQLARSLGFKASVLEDSHKDTSICYRIEISGSPEDKIKLFRLKRKKDLILKWYNNGKRKEYNSFNPIVSIKPLNYKEEMTCFYVDNNEHLFLMNDYIVTHNTRSMIADACYIGCSYIYDTEKQDWVYTNEPKSVLYIATEQDLSEVQTMCLAFLAAVDEEHILTNTYTFGEKERVLKAAELLKNSCIHFECTPDFSLLDIENMIKRHIRENNIEYCLYDYIHTSMKILEEVTKRSGGVRLREDNILFMLSTKLKEICVKYNIFILSSTQLSGDWKNTDTPDQTLLRGAKSIADRIDWGGILLEVTPTDIEKLQPILSKGMEKPNVKLSIYKNRQGRWKGIYLWMKADRAICRFDTIFATKYDYELIEMEDLKIKIEEKNRGAAF